LHAGTTQLVDGGAASGCWQSGIQRSLASRALLEAGRQHAAHDDFLDVGRLDAGASDSLTSGGGAQFDGRHAGQAALKTAHGSTGAADDDDIGHVLPRTKRGASMQPFQYWLVGPILTCD